MKLDVYWIPGPWLGKLAITARPRGLDWLAEELGGLRAGGVDVLVSLLEPDEAAELGLAGEAAAANSNGLVFVSFPIPDRSIPPDATLARRLIQQLQAELEAGKNVAIHCRQSVGRSGLIAAALLIAEGADEWQATQAVTIARGLTVPETAAQMGWLSALPQAQPSPSL